MEAVLAPAVDAFSARLPGIELTLRTAPFGDALQLLANGDSDLHCGGMDTDEPLPAFLRREYFLDITVGVVACEDHPLLAGPPTAADLADCPWIDYDAPLPAATVALADPDRPSSLDRLLDGLFRETGRRVSTVLRARAAGLCLMATGSWLAWLPLNFLERLTGPRLRPLPLKFGRYRYRAGFIARRSAEDLAPFQQLEETGARRCAGAELADAQIGEPVSVLDSLNSVNRCNSVRPLPGGGTRERDFDVTLGS